MTSSKANIIANSNRKARGYTSWFKDRIFDVGISYGPEGIVVVYHEPRRSFFQFALNGRQYRYWVEPSPTKQGLVRLARRKLRQLKATKKNQGDS